MVWTDIIMLLLQAQLEMQLIERLKLKQQQQVQAARQLEQAVAVRQSVRCVQQEGCCWLGHWPPTSTVYMHKLLQWDQDVTSGTVVANSSCICAVWKPLGWDSCTNFLDCDAW